MTDDDYVCSHCRRNDHTTHGTGCLMADCGCELELPDARLVAAERERDALRTALSHTITHAEHYECDFDWCVDARALLPQADQ